MSITTPTTDTDTDTDTDYVAWPGMDDGAPAPDAPVRTPYGAADATNPYAGAWVALAFIVAMIVGGIVLVACGYGDPGSRAALGLDSAGPVVSVATANVPGDRDAFVMEDSPRWDCFVDGNRLCAAFHGPTR